MHYASSSAPSLAFCGYLLAGGNIR